MKQQESLTWLYNLFNASNFDSEQNLDYLLSYPQTGIHFYLTRISQFNNRYLLHLVHIMFYHCDESISYPIMNLLIDKCLYSRSTSLKLFFILKSYRKYLNKNQIGFYRLIIQRIIECDKYRRDKFRQTVVLEFQPLESRLKSKREISMIGYEKLENQLAKTKITEGIPKNKSNKKEEKSQIKAKKQLKINDQNKKNLANERNNELNEMNEVSEAEKQVYNGEQKVMKKNQKQPNVERNKYRKKRYMLRTRPIIDLHRGTGDLSSIFLFFCSASAFFFPEKLLNNLISYQKMFNTFKAHSIIFPRRLDTTFKGCVNFLDDLIMISFRLKNLPKNIRQRALEIELEYLNQILPADINIPFSDGKKVLHLNVENSKTLNSVENAPYILTYECSNKIKSVKKGFFNDIYLLRQLYALEKTGNENQSIKDKIIEQLVMDDQNSSQLSVESDGLLYKDSGSTVKTRHGNVYKETIQNSKNSRSWTETVEYIKDNSVYKELNPDVKSIIIKTGNELGPELIASEVLSVMKDVFKHEILRIWIKPYKIYSAYHNAGFIEVITNAHSIHEIKKMHSSISSGKSFLKRYYCEKYTENLEKAIQNFLESLVGYSLVSYFLGLKDRHNGNILIDNEGHVVHVDFGFVLGLHPGIFCVETAPFKMSSEYMHLLGNRMDEFKKLFIQGFVAIRKNQKRLLQIMEICMGNAKYKFLDANAVDAFKKRMKNDLNNRELEDFIIGLIDWSIKSTTTGLYDSYQYFSNGFMK